MHLAPKYSVNNYFDTRCSPVPLRLNG